MHRISLFLSLIFVSLISLPVIAGTAVEISGTVNGSDIRAATTRAGALQVPYSKEFFVQGTAVNKGESAVVISEVAVKPDLFLFPTLTYPASAQMDPGETSSTQRTVNFETMAKKYVPKSLIGWLNNTTVKVNVKAYESSGILVDERDVWLHISNDVEVVPQSAIEAITKSPVAQAGAAVAGLSVAGAATQVIRRRKNKGIAALTSLGAALGVAIVLYVIGAIEYEELISIGAGEGAGAMAIVTFLAQMIPPSK